MKVARTALFANDALSMEELIAQLAGLSKGQRDQVLPDATYDEMVRVLTTTDTTKLVPSEKKARASWTRAKFLVRDGALMRVCVYHGAGVKSSAKNASPNDNDTDVPEPNGAAVVTNVAYTHEHGSDDSDDARDATDEPNTPAVTAASVSASSSSSSSTSSSKSLPTCEKRVARVSALVPILRQAHETSIGHHAGHAGGQKMFGELSREYANISHQLVDAYVRRCEVCKTKGNLAAGLKRKRKKTAEAAPVTADTIKLEVDNDSAKPAKLSAAAPAVTPSMSHVQLALPHPIGYHQFSAAQIARVRARLLAWYDTSRRKLPWRGDAVNEEEVAAATAAAVAAETTQSTAAASSESATATPATPSAEASSASVSLSAAGGSVATRPISAYGVWVSEIMLQQTRVATVIGYWLRWMAKFPTIQDLARASIDDVNRLWAGLGYYRRARFLLQGAQTIVEKYGGVMPSSVDELLQVPGIGAYTAGAIASIAFGRVTPLVDGNVIRVLARMRALEIDPKNRAIQPLLWHLAGQLVDPKRPGDFNQAVMELGATVCTPVNPQCAACPVRSECAAYQEVQQQRRPCSMDQVTSDNLLDDILPAAAANTSAEATSTAPTVVDIEDLSTPLAATAAVAAASSSTPSKPKGRKAAAPVDPFATPSAPCTFCDPARATLPTTVTTYPMKAARKVQVLQTVAVTILRRIPPIGQHRFLLVKRPNEGLLAGQYEFPSLHLPAGSTSSERDARLHAFLAVQFGCTPEEIAAALSIDRVTLGACTHIFSHRRHAMEVARADIDVTKLPSSAAQDRILDGGAAPASTPRASTESTASASATAATTVVATPSKKRTRATKSAANTTGAKRTKKAASAEDANDAVEADADAAERDDGGDDSDGEQVADAAATSATFVPQSYRWVTLAQLVEDHQVAHGSELGLTSGVRKVVKMLTDHLASETAAASDADDGKKKRSRKKRAKVDTAASVVNTTDPGSTVTLAISRFFAPTSDSPMPGASTA